DRIHALDRDEEGPLFLFGLDGDSLVDAPLHLAAQRDMGRTDVSFPILPSLRVTSLYPLGLPALLVGLRLGQVLLGDPLLLEPLVRLVEQPPEPASALLPHDALPPDPAGRSMSRWRAAVL